MAFTERLTSGKLQIKQIQACSPTQSEHSSSNLIKEKFAPRNSQLESRENSNKKIKKEGKKIQKKIKEIRNKLKSKKRRKKESEKNNGIKNLLKILLIETLKTLSERHSLSLRQTKNVKVYQEKLWSYLKKEYSKIKDSGLLS